MFCEMGVVRRTPCSVAVRSTRYESIRRVQHRTELVSYYIRRRRVQMDGQGQSMQFAVGPMEAFGSSKPPADPGGEFACTSNKTGIFLLRPAYRVETGMELRYAPSNSARKTGGWPLHGQKEGGREKGEPCFLVCFFGPSRLFNAIEEPKRVSLNTGKLSS